MVVDEDAVADAMVLLMERSKLYVEGAGAVGVSALLSERAAPARNGTTCVVLSGGNVDLGVVPGLVRRHETQAGRRLILFVKVSDRPGGLARLLSIFAEAGASVIDIEHVREGVDLHVRETGVTVILTTHYIEEAEEMADRIGVITRGELILVEEKAELMRKLGRKQLTLHLHQPLEIGRAHV